MILISSQISWLLFFLSWELKIKVLIELDKHIKSVHIVHTGISKTKGVLKSIFFTLSFWNFVHKFANSTEYWFFLTPGDSDPVDMIQIPKLHIVSKHPKCLPHVNLLISCLEILSYTL